MVTSDETITDEVQSNKNWPSAGDVYSRRHNSITPPNSCWSLTNASTPLVCIKSCKFLILHWNCTAGWRKQLRWRSRAAIAYHSPHPTPGTQRLLLDHAIGFLTGDKNTIKRAQCAIIFLPISCMLWFSVQGISGMAFNPYGYASGRNARTQSIESRKVRIFPLSLDMVFFRLNNEDHGRLPLVVVSA